MYVPALSCVGFVVPQSSSSVPVPPLRVSITDPVLSPLQLLTFVIVGDAEIAKGSVIVTVNVGGLSGQAGAIKLAISKALTTIDPKFRLPLKQKGYLTRDSRVVERKKYGRKKARRSFQFSKR